MTHTNTTPAEAIRVAAGMVRASRPRRRQQSTMPRTRCRTPSERDEEETCDAETPARAVFREISVGRLFARKTLRAHQQNNARDDIEIKIYTLMVLAAEIEH